MSQAAANNSGLELSGGPAATNPPVDIKLPSGALLALSVSAFGSGISMRVSDPLLPGLAKEFSLTLGHAALVITVFPIAYGFSQLIFGPLGDRFGKYRVIAWGTIACAVTTAICSLAPTFELLLAARAMAGASAAVIIPLAMAWIGDVVSYERSQPILAKFMIGQVLGISSGVLLGGYAADYLHWRVPFEAIALYFALGGTFLLWNNSRLPLEARKTNPPQGSAFKRMVFEFGQVLAVPWARIVLLTVFAEGSSIFGSFAFMVTHIHQMHSMPLAMAGHVVMLFGLGGVLVAASYVIVAVFQQLVVGDAGLLPGRTGLLHAAQHAADQRHANGSGTPGRCRGGICSFLLYWSVRRHRIEWCLDSIHWYQRSDLDGRCWSDPGLPELRPSDALTPKEGLTHANRKPNTCGRRSLPELLSG
jgi:predicted MFS family arabinose efflux permease